jgi:Spy/CpxP family protein refolding chaperone
VASVTIKDIDRYNSSGRTIGTSEIWINDAGSVGLHIHVNSSGGRGQSLSLTPEQRAQLKEYFRSLPE